MTPNARTSRALAALALLPLLALTACSGVSTQAPAAAAPDDAGTSTAAAPAGLAVSTSPDQDRVRTTESPEAIALLPAAWAAKDELVVAVSAGAAPPLGFLADDDKTPIGNETDIAQLVADALGKELRLEVKAWADWPLALGSGDVDAVISNVTVTEERKETIDFSTYRNDELGWLVAADSDVERIAEPADVAGLVVGVGSGTNQEKILLEWDRQNTAAGLDPVQGPEYYEQFSDVLLALQSGRLDAYVGPNASLAYQAAVSPQDFKVVGTLNGGWPDTAQIAVATRKGADAADAVTAAINHAIADGSYARVLERWGLTSEAVAESQTNPPGLPKTS
ncbi:ABC transporter substrate-binding protein [Cellulomonas iranensis]|uniref:ABC transporter substrate-binding protein n=1 Tax=Cellulomonas iranensis TaxID=76862 RepID=UPI000B3CE852|nr:ABC transporter substrate-binding protein [Cellulomonas iranensis]